MLLETKPIQNHQIPNVISASVAIRLPVPASSRASAASVSSSSNRPASQKRGVFDRLRGKTTSKPVENASASMLPVFKSKDNSGRSSVSPIRTVSVSKCMTSGIREKKSTRVPLINWDDGKNDPVNFVRNNAESEIYTDWANHYLEKAKFKRFIQDLQADLADGVLLADVIEAVSNKKVCDICRKPKSVSQMIDNINHSLTFLSGLGVNVEGLTARDIRDGNLKAILGLFFSLSRHKQQQKQAALAATSGSNTMVPVGTRSTSSSSHPATPTLVHQSLTTGPPMRTSNISGGEMQSRLPSPFRQSGNSGAGGGAIRLSTPSTVIKDVPGNVSTSSSSIPTPNSSTVRKQPLVDRNRLSVTPAGIPQGGLNGGRSQSGSSNNNNNHAASRSTSPNIGCTTTAATAHSFIPQPSVKGAPVLTRQPSADKHIKSSNGGISKGTVSSTVNLRSNGQVTTTATHANSAATGTTALSNKSMLEKFKFFNSKDKTDKAGAVSKRTSSSSGFSSARSERSDSSNSICSESKGGCSNSTTPTTTTSGDTQPNSPIKSAPSSVATPVENNGSKLAVKAFARKTFGRALNGSKESINKQSSPSPKSSKKVQLMSDSSPSNSDKPLLSASTDNNISNSQPCKQSSKSALLHQATKVPGATSTNAKDSKEETSYASAIQPDNPIRESKIATLVAKAPTESLLNTKRSTSKDSLSSECSRAQMSTSSGSQSVSSGGTSIPKPTAAVKGTTKISKTAANGSGGSQINISSSGKSALMSIASKSGNNIASNGCSQIDFSQTLTADCCSAAMVASPSSSLLRAEKRGNVTPVNVSIAMVSPMPSSTSCENNGDRGKPPKPHYVKVEIGQMIKAGQRLVSCGGSSSTTRRKVETTFDNADEVITRETNAIQSTPTKETTFSEESEDVLVNVKPMQPLLRASPYGYMRSIGAVGGGGGGGGGGTYSSARTLVPSLHVSRLGLSRHLFTAHHDPTIYGSTGLKKLASMDGDYCSDVDSVDFSGGYMSDGDVLRGGNMRGDDIASGYMSEGGASLYSRRIQSRPRENMATVREGIQKSGFNIHDNMKLTGTQTRHGLEDSSSVSSGLSDTIAEVSTDENHTGSSAGSEHNAYGSLKRTPYDSATYHLHHNTGNGHVEKGRKVTSSSSSSLVAYQNQKSSNGKCVHKSDSAQQTESSAFRPNSNTSSASKKNNGDKEHSSRSQVSQVDRVELLRRGKSDLDGGRSKYKTDQGSIEGSLSSSSSTGILRKTGSSGNCSEKQNSNNGDSRRKALLSSKKEEIRKFDSCNMERDSTKVDGRSRSSRSGSLEPQSNHMPSSHHGRSQNMRGMTSAALASLVYSSSSRRPNSTCSVSSTGSSNKSGNNSRMVYKKSSDDRFNEMENNHYFDHGILNQNSTIPRPGSAQSRLESLSSCSLERRSRGRLNASNTQMLQDLYGIGSISDVEYGHSSSLGRRHKQYNFSTSTIPPTSKEFSMSNSSSHSGNSRIGHHNHHHHNGPRLSLSSSSSSKGQECISEHPSAYSVTFAEPNSSTVNASPYAWLRRSPSNVSSIASLPNPRAAGGSLTEAESMESLASTASSSVQAQIQHARNNSLTQACLMSHQRQSPSPKVARSNSIRSTKSEKLYPSMMQRSEDLDAYFGAQMSASVHANGRDVSQPASPTTDGPQGSTRYACLMGGSQSANSSPYHVSSRASSTIPSYVGNILAKMGSKDDELRTSSLSLASVNSSIYSTPEDKHNHEIRKLRRELADAHEKVKTLTSQLSTNNPWLPSGTSGPGPIQLQKGSPGQSQDWQAHVVAAFEQSLSNMTNRLQALTHTAEQKVTKDSELNELRSTIESLRKQSAEAGLTSANFTLALESPQCFRRHPSIGNGSSHEHRMSRQLSTDSMSSINSMSSVASHKSSDTNSAGSKSKKKKKGWLRSSFTKAFSRGKKNRNGSLSDVEDIRQMQSDTSTPNSPLMNMPHMMNGNVSGMKTSHSSSAIYDKEDDPLAPEMVKELKKQLREKDMVLTDIRLEALSSAHQLESLKETVTKMRTEMLTLKYDNERLQRMVSTKSLTSSQSSLTATDNQSERPLSASEMSAPPNLNSLLSEVALDRDGKRVTISVYLNCHGDSDKNSAIPEASLLTEVLVGDVFVSGKTKWDLLDGMVRRTFKDYILRVDPVSNLGLNVESVQCYHLGEVLISKESELPELLPCGYIVGEHMAVKVTLKGTKQNSVDSLAFDTLIPKSIVQRYISLLTEHRRIIMCGPSGTGKTYLAHKLAEFLVLRSGKQLTPGSIATFNVDHKSAKELRQYLSNVAEQCESSNASDLPSVIILDNLHHVGSLAEVFNGFLSAKYQKCPFIIGTMNHTTCSTTNLQLHHNFRWVLCANHMEPVKGFLGRHLRRKLVESEVRTNTRNADLVKVIDWMPKVWLQLNKFLETHSSSEVTIGPRLFMSCPIDISGSQVWFTDLWNYSVVPYLLEAVREGLQLYGRRAPWEDPTDWVIESYPWLSNGPSSVDWPSLLKLRPEDVGYEGHPGPGGIGTKSVCSNQSDIDGDPLFNMLMRLQEAASYSSPHSNDSDTTSLDSHNSSLQHDDGGFGGGTGIESTL